MPYRRLELAPYSPFHDIEGTVAKIRAQHPGITDMGVNQAIKRMLTGYKPRHKGRIVHLFGADILTADLTTIAAWPVMGDWEKRRLSLYPIDTGDRIPDDIEGPARRAMQEALATRGDIRNVNRSVLISPPGLSRTYVWRQSNGWMQEVSDDDYALILSTPANRRTFRDPDIYGAYVPVRSYDAPGNVVATARNLRDADYLIRQTQRRPSWSGADVGDD
jgi:hypothetical protein